MIKRVVQKLVIYKIQNVYLLFQDEKTIEGIKDRKEKISK